MFKAIVNGKAIKLNVPIIPSTELHDEKNEELFSLMNQAEELRAAIPAITTKIAAPIKSATPTLTKRKEYTNSSGYAGQGGCTDGTYIYFYIKPSDESNAGTFVKMKRSNYSVVSTKSLSLYHGNDMTYNPDTGYIYVATMQKPTESSSIVKVVNPETLTVIESITVPMYISAIAYEPSMKYFVGGSGGMTKYVFTLTLGEDGTHKYKTVKTLNLSSSPCYSGGSYTSQGITCDSAFIYHAWAYSPSWRIEIFDWLGNYKGYMSGSTSNSSGKAREIEWIDKAGAKSFIVGFYTTGGGKDCNIYTFNHA